MLDVLRSHRFTLDNEKKTQAEIASALTAAGIACEREVRLGEGDTVDIGCGDGVFIEVKLKGAKRAIYRQCARYCEHESVKALILATSVSATLPNMEKPTFVVSLGRAWL